MNRSFIFKVAGIFFLTLLMSWAVSYVNSLIYERQARQVEVKREIATSSASEQTIIGPVLIVPYTEEYPNTIGTDKDKKTEILREEHIAYVLPENLELNGSFTNEFKKLGIYKALMYQLGGTVKGTFRLPENFNIKSEHEGGRITLQPAYVSLGISDTRGINGQPEFVWNGEHYNFAQGSRVKALGNGIHAPIGILNAALPQTIPFEFKLNLRGMEKFSFTPIAENNSISLQSSWQHPHFNGSFLPDPATQQITPGGFSGRWAVSSLSSSNQAQFSGMMQSGSEARSLESLAIGFVEPINVYTQANRATKYGLLFIGLTFAGFFIFEILKRLRIHPAQYTLVGLAMALFYLLLISLSEHISFGVSYLIASLACVTLLGYYLTYVLKSKKHGLLFAGLLTALYSALYAILASEDNALLMGSLLVFGLLALTIVITRKVDWYQISNKPDISTNDASYEAA
jgi:inner membrane protein